MHRGFEPGALELGVTIGAFGSQRKRLPCADQITPLLSIRPPYPPQPQSNTGEMMAAVLPSILTNLLPPTKSPTHRLLLASMLMWRESPGSPAATVSTWCM